MGLIVISLEILKGEKRFLRLGLAIVAANVIICAGSTGIGVFRRLS